MTVQMELWQLIVLLMAFFGAVWAFGRALLAQIEKRLGERYESQEQARKESQQRWNDEFRKIEKHGQQVERDLLRLQAQLPNEYVRREDWIRFSGTIDKKLDELHKLWHRLVGMISKEKGDA